MRNLGSKNLFDPGSGMNKHPRSATLQFTLSGSNLIICIGGEGELRIRGVQQRGGSSARGPALGAQRIFPTHVSRTGLREEFYFKSYKDWQMRMKKFGIHCQLRSSFISLSKVRVNAPSLCKLRCATNGVNKTPSFLHLNFPTAKGGRSTDAHLPIAEARRSDIIGAFSIWIAEWKKNI